MYELKIITQMACAHQLREFEGRCENLHGHNWKIEVFVTGEKPEPNAYVTHTTETQNTRIDGR